MGKVFIYCLDGATFKVLKPMMDKGLLPNLMRMMQQGTRGILRSTVPPITVPAWSTFATGCNPGKHGIYEFLVKVPGTYEETPINRTYLGCKTLWRRLSDAGKRVLILNVPTTYPPEPVNGVLVAGFLTPNKAQDFIYPPKVRLEIEQRFGPYYLYMKTRITGTSLSDDDIAALIRDCRDMLEYKVAVAKYLYEKLDPHLTVLHVWGTDRIQHELWQLIDTSHPAHDPDLAARHVSAIEDYYSLLDERLGELMQLAGSDVDYLVISDHGFGGIHHLIDLNYWLYQQGYLHFKRDLRTLLKVALWNRGITWERLFYGALRLLKRLGVKLKAQAPYDELTTFRMGKKSFLLTMADVDFTRTLAYAKTGMGQLIINLKGREPSGCVEQSEYISLRDEIIGKLRSLTDPATGKRIEADIYTSEIYSGAHQANCPDITFLSQKDGYFAANLTGFTSNRVFIPIQGMYGNHTMDGVLIAAGPSLSKQDTIEGAGIIDIAPTVLYLLDEPIPSYMDGRLLKKLIDKERIKAKPAEYIEEEQGSDSQPAISSDEVEEMKRKLKDLGYLG